MKLLERNIRKETEKALLVAVAVRYTESGTFGWVNGQSGYYKEVSIWIPKSVLIDEQVNGMQIPAWIIKKNLTVRLNPIMDFMLTEDVIYTA